MMFRDIERIVKEHLGSKPESIRPIENVTNNTVYSFETAGKRYIMKFYRNRYWPEAEDCKLANLMSCVHRMMAEK